MLGKENTLLTGNNGGLILKKSPLIFDNGLYLHYFVEKIWLGYLKAPITALVAIVVAFAVFLAATEVA